MALASATKKAQSILSSITASNGAMSSSGSGSGSGSGSSGSSSASSGMAAATGAPLMAAAAIGGGVLAVVGLL